MKTSKKSKEISPTKSGVRMSVIALAGPPANAITKASVNKAIEKYVAAFAVLKTNSI
jgi:hypothetical protein